MKARTPLAEPPGGLFRIVLAASISLALHVAVLALPAPRAAPPQPQSSEAMAAIPVEVAGDAPLAPALGNAAAPPHLDAREESVSLSAPNPVSDSLPTVGANQSPARPASENIAPQWLGSPGPAMLAAAPLPEPGSSLPSVPRGGTEAGPSSDRQPGSATASGPSGPVAAPPSGENHGDGGPTPGGTGARGSTSGAEGAAGTSNVSAPAGGVLIRAKVLRGPKPAYPERARRRGEEGTVRLKVQVLPSGSVGEIEVVSTSGYPDLDKAAVECVKGQWKFTPATLDGKPKEDQVTVRFVFRRE